MHLYTAPSPETGCLEKKFGNTPLTNNPCWCGDERGHGINGSLPLVAECPLIPQCRFCRPTAGRQLRAALCLRRQSNLEARLRLLIVQDSCRLGT